MQISRETAIAIGVSILAVGAMAIDHLIGTESGADDDFPVDLPAFLVGTAVSLALVAILFRVFIPPAVEAAPERAGRKAIVFSALSVPGLALVFLGVPFPLAGAGIAIGLHGMEAREARLATAAVLLGGAVLVLCVGAYVIALIA
jgi:hypothetical protein